MLNMYFILKIELEIVLRKNESYEFVKIFFSTRLL